MQASIYRSSKSPTGIYLFSGFLSLRHLFYFFNL